MVSNPSTYYAIFEQILPWFIILCSFIFIYFLNYSLLQSRALQNKSMKTRNQWLKLLASQSGIELQWKNSVLEFNMTRSPGLLRTVPGSTIISWKGVGCACSKMSSVCERQPEFSLFLDKLASLVWSYQWKRASLSRRVGNSVGIAISLLSRLPSYGQSNRLSQADRSN